MTSSRCVMIATGDREGADVNTEDKQRVFDEALQRMRISKGHGAASLTAFRDAFGRMKLELDGLRASDADRDSFVDAIARAIDAEPLMVAEERDGLRRALMSAFHGLSRETTLLAVKCDFLARVGF
jgi:hypothetical protein